ncbi:MAG: YdcH family protein [Alphaproteobacteria bacterium]|nr:YdcH family protein [Alphaproteobacteria bacterium]
MKRLVEEHRLLDQQIQEMCQDPASNPLHIQRLKKSKLMLKDEIIKLRSRYLPDIIA